MYNDNFTVTFNMADADRQYALLMLKAEINDEGDQITATPGSFTADNILYVDQKASDDKGFVSFEVYPSGVKNSVILLGGSFNESEPPLTSPICLGTIYVSGFEVKGTVALQGRTSGKLNDAEVSLSPQTGDALTVKTDTDGVYIFETVEPGDYMLTVYMAGYLSYQKNTLSVNLDTELNTITLKGGDIVNDGQVTSSDLSNLLSVYLSTTTAPSDINGDGQVTSSDLSILLANYLISKAVE